MKSKGDSKIVKKPTFYYIGVYRLKDSLNLRTGQNNLSTMQCNTSYSNGIRSHVNIEIVKKKVSLRKAKQDRKNTVCRELFAPALFSPS